MHHYTSYSQKTHKKFLCLFLFVLLSAIFLNKWRKRLKGCKWVSLRGTCCSPPKPRVEQPGDTAQLFPLLGKVQWNCIRGAARALLDYSARGACWWPETNVTTDLGTGTDMGSFLDGEVKPCFSISFQNVVSYIGLGLHKIFDIM